MEAKHTPGPWQQLNEDSHRVILPGMPICRLIADCDGQHTYSESIANARLIAAAPDLLEALRQAFDILREQELKDVFGYEWHGIARAAIAKATGTAA